MFPSRSTRESSYKLTQPRIYLPTVRSLTMAASLMTQWLFNFVIAKLTPIMLADITYGTYLLFGSCCIMMLFYAVFFVPETKGVPLESIGLLFEGNIIAGATRDIIPGSSRAKQLRETRLTEPRDGRKLGEEEEGEEVGHVENTRA